MNNRFLVVIAPNGNLHVTSVDDKGHALKLIEYFDINNISYNKEDAIYTTSQEFAMMLSNLGYIVFTTEDDITCIFINDAETFSVDQLDSIHENKDLIKNLLSNNNISFNVDLQYLLDGNNYPFDVFLNYVENKVRKNVR